MVTVPSSPSPPNAAPSSSAPSTRPTHGRLRLLDRRHEGRQVAAVVAHARRAGRVPQQRAGAGPEAGAARAGAGAGLRPHRVDLRPAAGAERPPQLTKLGVVAEEYHRNVYGESTSVAAPGHPHRSAGGTVVDSPAARRAAGGAGGPLPLRATEFDGAAPTNSPGAPGVAGQRRPFDWSRRAADAARNSDGLHRDAAGRAGVALEWRMCTREIFEAYFARGYRVVDFFLDRPAGCGRYLLAGGFARRRRLTTQVGKKPAPTPVATRLGGRDADRPATTGGADEFLDRRPALRVGTWAGRPPSLRRPSPCWPSASG